MGDDILASETEFAEFLARFEDGTWPVAQFHHREHLVVAAVYLMDGDEAMDRLRTNIKTYNVSQGGQNTEDRGYHETITRFWAEVTCQFIGLLPSGLSRLEVARGIVGRFGSARDLFKRYYDFDVLASRTARAEWLPPSWPVSVKRMEHDTMRG